MKALIWFILGMVAGVPLYFALLDLTGHLHSFANLYCIY